VLKPLSLLLSLAMLAVAAASAPAFAQQPTSKPGLASEAALDPDGDGTPGAPPYATAELISERSALIPGDVLMAALKLDLDAGGWHVYWKNPGDSGLPPEIEWELPEGVQAGEFVWPAPHYIPLANLANYGYKNQVILPFEVRVPASLAPGSVVELKGEATWLICLETCIPESAAVSLSVPVEAAPRANADAAAQIAASLAVAPEALGGNAVVQRTGDTFSLLITDPGVLAQAASARSVRFFPDGPDLIHAAPQEARKTADGVLLALPASEYASTDAAPLSGIIAFENADETRRVWTVNAQPGEIPAGVGGARIGAAGGLFAGGGLGGAELGTAGLLAVLGFAFLGGLVLNLMPCVLPVLSIKAASLARTAHNPGEARMHGVAYLGGVLVCFLAIGAILVALRSAGVQAGLGFQLQYPPVVAFFALAMFAIGLNLLGVFEIGGSLQNVGSGLAQRSGVTGAFFTGMLAAFVGAPCVGPFMAPAVGVALAQPPGVVVGVFAMIGLGMAAPLLLLSFTPALAKLLPKPGAWMNTFRQVLAFPMFLTAIWLLWVLAGQAGSDAVILTVMGATALGFGIWLATKTGQGWVGRIASGLVILAALAGTTFAAGTFATPAVLASASASGDGKAHASEPWSLARIEELQADKRVVFVDFTARWCVTCQVNERGALASAEVRNAFSTHNVAMLIGDWTNQDEVIAAELARHGRAGVPLYLVYPASGGAPEVLPQLLSPGLVVKAIEAASGASPGGT
jgi:DsbC/DsbD-like thiol-disulfide interchange protein/cytochrome c biogenesis protein CcdA